MTLENLPEIAPEIVPLLDIVSKVQGKVYEATINNKLKEINALLIQSLPNKQLIASLFYSEGDIANLANCQDRLNKIFEAVNKQKSPLW